ncbi:hypothetical protein NPIL_99461 [Nephila pilipes]|uniref:Uncharacterized protein n=1 Tax=Nephila pilipes TaxID=299642 RepID=A0A8X6TUS2_NEPPI|nr:hypothetical protein NPIL_99461 [Nephila pilipes]
MSLCKECMSASRSEGCEKLKISGIVGGKTALSNSYEDTAFQSLALPICTSWDLEELFEVQWNCAHLDTHKCCFEELN